MAAAAGGGTKRGWSLFLLGCGVGGVVGFGAGVASVKAAREAFTAAFQDERSAEVDAPQSIDRPAFRLQYPRNWKVDAAGADHDPDRNFSIDSPGQSFVMFVIATGEMDPRVAASAHVSQQTAKLMRDAKRTPFARWGPHGGVGPGWGRDRGPLSHRTDRSTRSCSPGTLLIGKYRVDREIGSGGMAVVVEATHVDLGQRVAIKLLDAHRASSPEIVARFLREARVAANLPSEHITKVTDVGQTEAGIPYLVMELLTGHDLATELERRAASSG